MKKFINQGFSQWRNRRNIISILVLLVLGSGCQIKKEMFDLNNIHTRTEVITGKPSNPFNYRFLLSGIDTCSYREKNEILEKVSLKFIKSGDISILYELFSYQMSLEVLNSYQYFLEENYFRYYKNKTVLARIFYLSLVTHPYHYIEIVRREDIRSLIDDNYLRSNATPWKYLKELTFNDLDKSISQEEKKTEWNSIRDTFKNDERVNYVGLKKSQSGK